MKMTRFLILGFLMAVSVCRAQLTNEGWYNMSGTGGPLPENGGDLFPTGGGYQIEALTQSFPQGTNPIAEFITPEIQSLARGLENDPLRIFNYVHDHIRHVLYFGSKKGAQLTLLERSGNDFDQCALLVALLNAAGYTNTGYQFGMLQMPYSSADNNDLRHWLNLELVNTNAQTISKYFGYLLAKRGYPFYFSLGDGNTIAFPRVWVTLTNGATVYYLDPAFKISDLVQGIDLPAAMGLSSNTLWTVAQGTVTPNYVQNINESALRSKLQEYTSNLLSTLQSSYPNASVEDVVGCAKIRPWTNSLSQSLIFSTYTHGGDVPIQSWTYQPVEFMAKLTIGYLHYGGWFTKTWNMPELQGRRLSLVGSRQYFGGGIYGAQVYLRIDDTQIYSAPSFGGTLPVIISNSFPYGSWDITNNIPIDTLISDYSITKYYNSGEAGSASYAITYAFEPDLAWLQQRQRQLDAYRQQGYADDSQQVVTETLNIMGLNWMLQTKLCEDLLARQAHALPQYHLRIGRMMQVSSGGYGIDAYLQVGGLAAGIDTDTNLFSSWYSVFDVASYMHSAQEHALIEQLQTNGWVGASTVKLLQLANSRGQAIYLADSNNWSAVSSNLVNYDLGTLGSYINNGCSLLLPTNGSIPLIGAGNWTGYGYMLHLAEDDLRVNKMEIGGGYSGGFVSGGAATVNPAFIASVSPDYPNYIITSSPYVWASYSGDPVNMADSSFRVTATDLSLGQSEPRGITFTRFYSSGRRQLNPATMGYGWTHNYNLTLDEVSSPTASLGGTIPAQMAPMLVASCAALNFYDTQLSPKNWMVTALIAKWGIDQTISNAVTVALGNDTIQFIKQPDGSFTPPANCTMTLSKGSTYLLKERRGNAFVFNSSRQLTTITNPSGNALNLSYTSGRLTSISDWKNRSLTLTYSGTPLSLTQVSDNSSPTRFVSYGYVTNGDGKPDLVWARDPESKTNRYLYDSSHQITATYDALNQLVVSNINDSFGRVTTQFAQGDLNKMWQFYWSGWQTVAQDPASSKHRYFFDDKAREIGYLDPLGNFRQRIYDGQDHVVMTISPMNETNQFIYDGSHNVTNFIDALGFQYQFVYDSQNNLLRSIDPLNNISRFGFNSRFQLKGATNGADDWVTYDYNAGDGTLTNRTDAGGATSFGYDSFGNLSSIGYPGGLGGESFVNSQRGNVTSHTDARGYVTTYQYSLRGELTNAIAPTNLTTSVAYDAVGNVRSVKNPRGFSVVNTWSPTRKLTSTALPTTPQGTPVVTNIYDGRDWLMQSIDPLQRLTAYTNDVAGRPLTIIDPLQRPTTFGFDADGRRTAATNAAQEFTQLHWSSRGENTLFTDPAGHSVGHLYDAAGNMIRLTNRNGRVWQFQYDGANRLTNTISPFGGRQTKLSFNSRGLLQSVTEPSTQITTNDYDAKGRLISRYDLAGTIKYSYDLNDNLTGVTNAGQTNGLVWTYDAYNRIGSYKDMDGNLIQYRYDAGGNLTNLVYPGNRTVRYFYDNLNRLTNVTDWANRQTSFTYDLASRLSTVTRPNGTIRAISYDDVDEITNIVEQTASRAPIAFFRLNWNNAGRVQWEFAAPLPQANQMPTRKMSYFIDNHILSFNGSYVGSDVDGNMTSGPLTNDTFVTYGYNARNQLTNVAGISYAYDPIGNRIAITNGAEIARFVVNPNAALPQVLIRINGGVTNYYVYGLGLLYEITESATATNILTYHYDYRGSTVALTDNNGNVTDRIEYSAYGTTTYRAGTNNTPFLFNGRYGVQTDPNGLLYMRARYYNPYICRFINADPIGFAGGLNFYAYADGNPVSMIDPFGLCAEGEVWDGGFWTGVRQFSYGYADALDSFTEGAAAPFLYPRESWNAFRYALSHPVLTGRAIGQNVTHTFTDLGSSDLRVEGKATGGVLLTVASVVAPWARLTRLARVERAMVTANVVDDAARFIVSPKGTAVERAIAARWAKGTFGNVVDSIEYHFAKHGGGRTLQQYTDDAVRFFEQNKGQAEWGKWNPNWEPAYRLKIGNQGGYFTADGRVLTYWD